MGRPVYILADCNTEVFGGIESIAFIIVEGEYGTMSGILVLVIRNSHLSWLNSYVRGHGYHFEGFGHQMRI